MEKLYILLDLTLIGLVVCFILTIIAFGAENMWLLGISELIGFMFIVFNIIIQKKIRKS